jgi:hypothetical protein
MTLNKLVFLNVIISITLLQACNTASQISQPETAQVAGLVNGTFIAAPVGTNVMSFTVNGSTCSNGSYVNKPCVSLTICNPGSTTICQVVNDILLDTGSYGLRVFKSTISGLTLTPVTAHQGGALTRCQAFADGTTEWGQVVKANVTLGGMAAVTVPIQVIDSAFATLPAACTGADTSPAAAGFNGILGVGLEAQDCGNLCVWTLGNAHENTNVYFSCTNGATGYGNAGNIASCVGGSTTTLADQIQNPVVALATDNNGLIVRLPAISNNGAASTTGYVIFGIGTRANNTPPSTAVKIIADSNANMITNFNNTDYSGFLDTGSNGLYFSTTLPTCSGWFCPNALTPYSPINRGADNLSSTPRSQVNFQVANSTTLFSSGNRALNDLGAANTQYFDFGLPFYFGRDVYVGISGTTSTPFGTGPYWAY